MKFLDEHNLFTRPDTFFGVCQGLGEDLRIHPNIIRLAFAALMFWNPLVGFCGYAGAGLLVFATRFFYPEPTVAQDIPAESPAAVAEAAPPQEEEQLPLAA